MITSAVARMRRSECAPAKFNLSLRVLGRRADGYHELDSLVAFADCGDRVFVTPEAPFALSISGPFADALNGANILEATVRLFAQVVPDAIFGRVELEKNLPVAAGLGGGSADAAALLRLLIRINGERAEQHDWVAIATCLGADVPVCLASKPSRMTGIGERLQFLDPLPGGAIVLANPLVPLPTADVFRALSAPPLAKLPEPGPAPCFTHFANLIDALATEPNDLEPVAVRLCPVVARVLDTLRDCPQARLVRMSGSGPTCFALCETLSDAKAVAATLKGHEPRWWVRAARIATHLPAFGT